jgi:hypothetical protein
MRFKDWKEGLLFFKKGNCPGSTEIPAEAKTSGRKRCFFEKKNQKTFDPLG